MRKESLKKRIRIDLPMRSATSATTSRERIAHRRIVALFPPPSIQNEGDEAQSLHRATHSASESSAKNPSRRISVQESCTSHRTIPRVWQERISKESHACTAIIDSGPKRIWKESKIRILENSSNNNNNNNNNNITWRKGKQFWQWWRQPAENLEKESLAPNSNQIQPNFSPNEMSKES